MAFVRSRDASESHGHRPIVLLVIGALIGAGLAGAGLTAPSAGGALPAGVVAMVNGEPVRTEDYARMVEAVAADKRDPLTEADRRRILERLIDEELLVQRGLALRLAHYDRRVRADLTSTVIDSVVGEAGEAEPGDDEVEAFYAVNRDFFAGPGRVRVRQVFVRVSTPADGAAQARAEEAARRLRAGESFATVAEQLGDPPLAPLPDAALPPAKLRDYLGPTALRVALELDSGAISDPVRSGMGYHVLQVVERQPDAAPALADVRTEVIAELRRRSGEQALRRYLDQLRDSATVVVLEPLP